MWSAAWHRLGQGRVQQNIVVIARARCKQTLRFQISATPALLPRIESRIVVLHGLRLMIDADLAVLCGVSAKRLNEPVKRNTDRFPDDFVFKLHAAEKAEVVENCDHPAKLNFSKVLLYAFTEHRALQAANVLANLDLTLMHCAVGTGHMVAAQSHLVAPVDLGTFALGLAS